MADPAPAKFNSSAPVLFVRNIHAAAEHYRDAMGFKLGRFYGEPEVFTIIGRDGMYVMLKQVAAELVVPHAAVDPEMWQMYFWVDDADALFAEFTQRGATISYPPCDRFYGCREFGARDLDGHEIGFGQILAKPD